MGTGAQERRRSGQKPYFIVMNPLTVLLILFSGLLSAQELVIFKIIDTTELQMEIITPPDFSPLNRYPAILFFYGGGWTGGSLDQFRGQARYFSKRGMVCFLAEYRTQKVNGTSPFEAVMDAKSIMRYIRAHAREWALDTTRIAASGGSAGGHLAASLACIDAYDDPADDLSVTTRPDALLLFNPVIDNGPAGYGYNRIGEAFPAFSPLHNIRAGMPPTIVLLGTEDSLIPVATAEYFCAAIRVTGGICKLKLYEGAKHGFFNPRNLPYYQSTILEVDHFLQRLGWLAASPAVAIEK